MPARLRREKFDEALEANEGFEENFDEQDKPDGMLLYAGSGDWPILLGYEDIWMNFRIRLFFSERWIKRHFGTFQPFPLNLPYVQDDMQRKALVAEFYRQYEDAVTKIHLSKDKWEPPYSASGGAPTFAASDFEPDLSRNINWIWLLHRRKHNEAIEVEKEHVQRTKKTRELQREFFDDHYDEKDANKITSYAAKNKKD